jgi:hypothetical protein
MALEDGYRDEGDDECRAEAEGNVNAPPEVSGREDPEVEE